MTTLVAPIERQHTVSRVVLKQFTWRKKVSVYDRDKKVVYSKGPGGIFHENFDQFDPNRSEKEWGRVEVNIPRVYDLLASRAALQDPDAVRTLRELVAVHWVRSPAMRLAHERVKRNVLRQSIARLRENPEFLAAAFTKETGLVPAGQAALDWFNHEVHGRVDQAHGAELFSERLILNLRTVLTILERHHVQIGYADGALDLVIGDAPVVTTKPGHDGVGPHQGVAMGDANLVVMPISPRILVAMGPEPGEKQLSDDEVAHYNILQTRGFVRWIGCKPGGKSDALLRRNARDEGLRVYP